MKYKLSCRSLYEDEQYYWFSEMKFNGFYRVDKKTLVAELLFHFPDESLEQEHLYPYMKKINDWFVFAPQRGKNIVLYHEQTKELKTFPLKIFSGERKIKNINFAKFSSVVSYEHDIFFFPATYPAIVKLNLVTMSLSYLETATKKINAMVPEFRSSFQNTYFGIGQLKEDKVYLPLGCANHLGIYDIKTDQLELQEIEGETLAFYEAFLQGEDCILIPKIGSDLSIWNQNKKEVKTYPVFSAVEGHEIRTLVHSPLIHQNTLYFSPTVGSAMYQMDLETESVSEVSFMEDLLPKTHKFPHFSFWDMFCVRLDGDVLSFISGKTHDWYQVNLETQKFTVRTIQADGVGEKILSEKTGYFGENFSADLESYCEFLKSGQQVFSKKQSEETIGQKIFRSTT